MPVDPGLGESLASRVLDSVAPLEASLLKRVADAVRATLEGNAEADDELARLNATLLRAQRLRAEIARGIRSVDAEVLKQVQQLTLLAYNVGTGTALADLESLGFEQVVLADPEAAAELLSAPAAEAVRSAFAQLPAQLTRVYQDAIQAASGEVLGGLVTRRAAAQHALDRLGSQGITGFVDREGRRWSLTAYTEMAVRTATGQAAVAGHVDAIKEAGLDLVIVSDAPRECPLCRPWEGKVLSLTGAIGDVVRRSATSSASVRVSVAGTLAQAKSAGFQHPNCRHSVSAYVPGATTLRPAKADPAGYEAVQAQRAMERKVREWKRRQALALDDQAAAQAAGKVRQWQVALREHVDANDLKRLYAREQVGTPGNPRAT